MAVTRIGHRRATAEKECQAGWERTGGRELLRHFLPGRLGELIAIKPGNQIFQHELVMVASLIWPILRHGGSRQRRQSGILLHIDGPAEMTTNGIRFWA